MRPPLGTLPTADFLREYWQQKPLLVRQAFPEIRPALSVDDLAGLACEDGVESRLVSGGYPAHDWKVRYGPFEESELVALPDHDWTLLLQDAEKHYPPLHEVLEAFAFLPCWRLDDLMISVAAPGGSVGPHVDEYDVFLLQVQGQRRWQLSQHYMPDWVADCELRVLQEFRPEQEWILHPGDMLYLPPGVAHYGLALDFNMTYSIGLRAPSQPDLLLGLGEWLSAQPDAQRRYRDPAIADGDDHLGNNGELTGQQLASLATFLPGLPEVQRNDFLASFISSYRLPAPPEADAFERRDGANPGHLSFVPAGTLSRSPWSRLVWYRHGATARLFVNGEAFSCSHGLATALCAPSLLLEIPATLSDADRQVLAQLLHAGHLQQQSR